MFNGIKRPIIATMTISLLLMGISCKELKIKEEIKSEETSISEDMYVKSSEDVVIEVEKESEETECNSIQNEQPEVQAVNNIDEEKVQITQDNVSIDECSESEYYIEQFKLQQAEKLCEIIDKLGKTGFSYKAEINDERAVFYKLSKDNVREVEEEIIFEKDIFPNLHGFMDDRGVFINNAKSLKDNRPVNEIRIFGLIHFCVKPANENIEDLIPNGKYDNMSVIFAALGETDEGIFVLIDEYGDIIGEIEGRYGASRDQMDANEIAKNGEIHDIMEYGYND